MSDNTQTELTQYASSALATKPPPGPVESTVPPLQGEYSQPQLKGTAMPTDSEDHKYVSLAPMSLEGVESDSHKYTVPHIQQKAETAHKEDGRCHRYIMGVLVVFLIISVAINITLGAYLFIHFTSSESEVGEESPSSEYISMLSQLRQDVVSNVSCNDTKLSIIESLLLQVTATNSLSSDGGQGSGDSSLYHQEINSLVNITQENTRLLKYHVDSSMISNHSHSKQLSNIVHQITILQNIMETLASITNGTNEIGQEIKSRVEILNNQHVSTPVLLDLKSCQDIRNSHPNSTSGYYFINSTILYCEMGELCGSEGGWTRLAYLDMNDSTVNCPDGLALQESGDVRACSRPTEANGCSLGVTFPSYGVSYSEVCGRVVGYQFGDPEGDTRDDIDSAYLDGISITRGSPRQHVWSLIAGPHENYLAPDNCPCNNGSASDEPPSFVGNDYFCESGNPNVVTASKLYAVDPLWDGAQCGDTEVNCCSMHLGLPWFHKTLSTTTSDFLELRNCGNASPSNENIYINFYEIFVK